MRTGLKIGRTAEQAIAILEQLKRGETVRYASLDGVWDFTSKKLEEPKQTEPARIWFDEAGNLFNE